MMIDGCSKVKPVDTLPYESIKMSADNANLIFIGTLDKRVGQGQANKVFEKDNICLDEGYFTIEKCLKGTYPSKSISLPCMYYKNGTRPVIKGRYIVFGNIINGGRSNHRILEAAEENIKKVEEEINANQTPPLGNPAPPSP